MYIDPKEILKRVGENDRVLDLGGWERVFPRANVVADLLPYETRKRVSNEPEHFTKEDWIIADFCSSAFWEKIPDKAFDFVTIGHTLEDIRDPLYVCSQMIRCSKAGYIEAPSKFRELSKAHAAETMSGYAHHRWTIEPMHDLEGLIFRAKLGWAHQGDYLGEDRRHLLRDFFHHFDGYFWQGSFKYLEHFTKGNQIEGENIQWYFNNYVRADAQRNNILDLAPNQSSADDGKCLWVTDYLLDIEYEAKFGSKPKTFQRYF